MEHLLLANLALFAQQALDLDQLLYRWVHLIAGVLWLAMLLSYTLVNTHAVAALEPALRARVVPESLPRTMFWSRWAALISWVSGAALLMKLYYASGSAPIVYAASSDFAGQNMPAAQWLQAFAVLLALVGVFELIARGATARVELGYLAWSAVVVGYGSFLDAHLHMSQRAILIHIGALLGTTMLSNAWLHMAPAVERIVAAVRAGGSAEAADVQRLSQRSRHSVYQAMPLLLFMVSVHQERLLGYAPWQLAVATILVLGLLIGWTLRTIAARISV
jgi:uncharacterized membrane protein